MGVDLSFQDYIDRNHWNVKVPPRLNYCLISIDKKKYRTQELLMRKNIREEWLKLKSRVTPEIYCTLRSVFRRSMYHSKRYLPGYKFFWKEMLHKDWLATVDWSKYHRVHLIHQNLTAYCGNLLLNGIQQHNFEIKFNDNKSLLDWTIEVICNNPHTEYFREYAASLGISPSRFIHTHERNKIYWKKVILNTLYAASLYHDSGYPWQYISSNSIGIGAVDPLKNTSKAEVQILLDRYEDKLMFYPFRQYNSKKTNISSNWKEQFYLILDECITKKHGLRSAINFLHLNERFRKYPDFKPNPTKTLISDWAALIIIMHDLSSIYCEVSKVPSTSDYSIKLRNPQLRLKFPQVPLSCIMCLSDQIQDFGRHDGTFIPNTNFVTLSYKSRCINTQVAFSETNGELKIKHHYPNYSDRLRKRKSLRKEYTEFFNPLNGYLDLSYVGVRSVSLEVGP